MKFSEAIRKGSKVMRQEFGNWTRGDGRGCTLTMAACGVGLTNLNASDEVVLYAAYDLIKMYPILTKHIDVPCGCKHNLAAYHAIIHLNDRHFWSAERIAGWVESHLETPTYSMLEIQEFMGEPVKQDFVPDSQAYIGQETGNELKEAIYVGKRNN